MSDGVNVFDAGGKLMFSGADRLEVEAALQAYLQRGAKVLTPISQVANKWVAACSIPIQGSEAAVGSTQSLSLSDLAKDPSAKPEESTDGCRVEEHGFTCIVHGPTRVHVKARVDEMTHFGAKLVGEIEEADGEWVAVCDIAGAQNSGYRW